MPAMLRWSAVPVGFTLAVSVPMLVAQGDRAHPVVAAAAAIALLLTALLWVARATRGPAHLRSLATTAAMTVMAGGLVIATTGFFLAIGAAIATAGAGWYGTLLAVRSSPRPRIPEGLLLATALAVTLAVIIGDISSEAGFWAVTLSFSVGMGMATAALAVPLNGPDQHEERLPAP